MAARKTGMHPDILPHRAYGAQRRGPKNEFFFVISVIFVVKYFHSFSTIWHISRLKIPSKSFPFRLLRRNDADYKNSLK
jgi:hypothetical protein